MLLKEPRWRHKLHLDPVGNGRNVPTSWVERFFCPPILSTEPTMIDILPKVATPANDPPLDFSGLPCFTDIRPGHIASAVDVLLEHTASAVTQTKDPAMPVSWDTVVTALENATESLDRA